MTKGVVMSAFSNAASCISTQLSLDFLRLSINSNTLLCLMQKNC